MTIDRYRAFAAELSQLDAARADAIATATRAHTAAAAPATDAVEIATAALRAASETARAAAARVDRVDGRAGRLWQEMRALLGRRGRRLGDLPTAEADLTIDDIYHPPYATAQAHVPGTSHARGASHDPGTPRASGAPHGKGGSDTVHMRDATAALDAAAETIARVALGQPIVPIPMWTLAVLPFVGALSALTVTLPVHAVLASTAGSVGPLRMLADVLLFGAPFAGIAALTRWTRRRFCCRPDIGTIGVTLLGGMVATATFTILTH